MYCIRTDTIKHILFDTVLYNMVKNPICLFFPYFLNGHIEMHTNGKYIFGWPFSFYITYMLNNVNAIIIVKD